MIYIYLFAVWLSPPGWLCIAITQIISIAASFSVFWVRSKYRKIDSEKEQYFERVFLPACVYQAISFIAASIIPAVLTQDNTGIASGILSMSLMVMSPVFAIFFSIVLNHYYSKHTGQKPLRNSFSVWLGSFAWGILSFTALNMLLHFIIMLSQG